MKGFDARTALAQQSQLWWEEAHCWSGAKAQGEDVKAGSSLLHLHLLGKAESLEFGGKTQEKRSGAEIV